MPQGALGPPARGARAGRPAGADGDCVRAYSIDSYEDLSSYHQVALLYS